MANIPPDKLLPQDLVDIFDHGPEDEPFAEPVRVRMHASDAGHAMDVEPGRWKLNSEPPVMPADDDEEV